MERLAEPMEKKMSDKRMTATEVLKQQKRIGDYIEIDLIEEIRKRHEEDTKKEWWDKDDIDQCDEDRATLLAKVEELEEAKRGLQRRLKVHQAGLAKLKEIKKGPSLTPE
jgi:hypothetical protein